MVIEQNKNLLIVFKIAFLFRLNKDMKTIFDDSFINYLIILFLCI